MMAPQGHFCLQSAPHSHPPASHRSTEGRTASAGLQEDMGSMLGWLDKVEGVLAIPLQPAEPQQMRKTLDKVQVPLRHQTAVKRSSLYVCVHVRAWVSAEQCNLIQLLS